MDKPENSRREFLKVSSAAVAGASLAPIGSASATPVDTAKILNYNAKMTYRPLGNTGHMISEVSLGGHGGKTVEDRVPVLEKAVELGLKTLINLKRQENIRQFRGKLPWRGDLDEMRTDR